MPVVTFKPSDLAVEVKRGVTLYDAAKKAGLPVASSCDGDFTCGKCNVQVIEGFDSLSQRQEDERELLRRERNPETDRISCRAQVQANCTITTRYW